MPAVSGSSAANSIHFALPVSRRMVSSVELHGQWSTKNTIVQSV